jgi:hypothetical protein
VEGVIVVVIAVFHMLYFVVCFFVIGVIVSVFVFNVTVVVLNYFLCLYICMLCMRVVFVSFDVAASEWGAQY